MIENLVSGINNLSIQNGAPKSADGAKTLRSRITETKNEQNKMTSLENNKITRMKSAEISTSEKGKKKKKRKKLPEGQHTPYQGDRKTFGYFECEACHNDWASAHSWAETYQQCKQCWNKVFPYAQTPLLWGKKKAENRPPHAEDLCQKCRQLGSPCWIHVNDPLKKSKSTEKKKKSKKNKAKDDKSQTETKKDVKNTGNMS